MNQQRANSVIEHPLDPSAYRPIIIGQIDELVERLEKLRPHLPKLVEIFQGILKAHRNKHHLLEDWLIIPIYGFIWCCDSWDKDSKRLEWVEGRFVELANAIGEESWSNWVAEIIQQTNCLTTHRICDRIYDYFLHMYGALYLIRQGWNIQFLPMQKGGPDIVGNRWEEHCVMECKFKHISKKFESFFWRFDTAYSRCSKKPFVLSAQFRFPNAEGLQELSQDHCLLLKEFISKVYLNTEVPHRGFFGDMVFEYHPPLPMATSIVSQSDMASSSAIEFVQGNLSSMLDRASGQLNNLKYQNYQKFLFVGLQPDPLFSMPWTDANLREVKLLLALKAHWEYRIATVFSDDVGFSVAGYL